MDEKARQRQINQLSAEYGIYELRDTDHLLAHPEGYQISFLKEIYGDCVLPDSTRILERLERLTGPSENVDFVDCLRELEMDWDWMDEEYVADEEDVMDSNWIRYRPELIIEDKPEDIDFDEEDD